MGGERTALQDELGAVQLQLERLRKALERIGRPLRPGPDNLVVFPVLRYLDRQREGFAADPLRGGDGFPGVGIAEEGQGEVDFFGGYRLAADVTRYFLRPIRQRLRGIGRRPEREEQAHGY